MSGASLAAPGPDGVDVEIGSKVICADEEAFGQSVFASRCVAVRFPVMPTTSSGFPARMPSRELMTLAQPGSPLATAPLTGRSGVVPPDGDTNTFAVAAT